MTRTARPVILPSIVTSVVAASVIVSIVTLGGPSAQRQRKLDEVRVQNLTLISLSMNAYFTRHGKLPGDLDLLGKEPGYRIAQKDPDTGKPYKYDVLGATSYRLCADFAGDTGSDSRQSTAGYFDVQWIHGAGHQCFDRVTGKVAR